MLLADDVPLRLKGRVASSTFITNEETDRPKQQRVAITYARISDREKEHDSIPRQFDEGHEWASGNNVEIIAEFFDTKSGKSKWGRIGLEAAFDRVRAGGVDLFIVEEFARLARSTADGLDLYRTLKHHNVELISLLDGKATLINLAHKLLEAEGLLVNTTCKVQNALIKKFRDGTFDGPFRWPYRRQRDEDGQIVRGKWEIDPEKAPIIVWMYDAVIAGMPPSYIAKHLNEEGIPGPRGRLWTSRALLGRGRSVGLLRCEMLMGWAVWNRTSSRENPETGVTETKVNDHWLIREVPHLKIIEPEIWERVQEIADMLSLKPRSSRRPSTYLISGKMRCPVCGSKMEATFGGRPNGENKRTRYYRCKVATGATPGDPKRCANRKWVKADLIEKAIIDEICEQLDGAVPFSAFVRRYEHTSRLLRRDLEYRKKHLERQISLNRDHISIYERALLSKVWDLDYAGEKITALLTENRRLEKTLVTLSKEKPRLEYDATRLASYKSVADAVRRCFPFEPRTEQEFLLLARARALLGDIRPFYNAQTRGYRVEFKLFIRTLIEDPLALTEQDEGGWVTLSRDIPVFIYAAGRIVKVKQGERPIDVIIPDLSDEEWSIIRPLLPRTALRSVEFQDGIDRRTLSQMFYKFKAGVLAARLPDNCGFYKRLREWPLSVWADIFRELEEKLPSSLDGFNHAAFESWFETDGFRIQTICQILRQSGKPMPRKDLWNAMIDRGVWPVRGDRGPAAFWYMLKRSRDVIIGLPNYGFWLRDVPLQVGDMRRQKRIAGLCPTNAEENVQDQSEARMHGKLAMTRADINKQRMVLSDEEWTLIHPVLPPPAPVYSSNRTRLDDRAVASAIFYVLKVDARWSQLPEYFGTMESVRARFKSWRRRGIIEKILDLIQSRMPEVYATLDVKSLIEGRGLTRSLDPDGRFMRDIPQAPLHVVPG